MYTSMSGKIIIHLRQVIACVIATQNMNAISPKTKHILKNKKRNQIHLINLFQTTNAKKKVIGKSLERKKSVKIN